MLLAGLPEEHEGYAAALRRISPTGEPYPTAGLAARLFCVNGDERARLRALLDERRRGRCGCAREEHHGPFAERPLRLGDALWSALQGIDIWPQASERFATGAQRRPRRMAREPAGRPRCTRDRAPRCGHRAGHGGVAGRCARARRRRRRGGRRGPHGARVRGHAGPGSRSPRRHARARARLRPRAAPPAAARRRDAPATRPRGAPGAGRGVRTARRRGRARPPAGARTAARSAFHRGAPHSVVDRAARTRRRSADARRTAHRRAGRGRRHRGATSARSSRSTADRRRRSMCCRASRARAQSPCRPA